MPHAPPPVHCARSTIWENEDQPLKASESFWPGLAVLTTLPSSSVTLMVAAVDMLIERPMIEPLVDRSREQETYVG